MATLTYKCLHAGCNQGVSGFWCREHRPRWAVAMLQYPCEGHVWLSGTITLWEDKPGVMSGLPEPPEGRVWEICKMCDEVRSIPQPHYSNEPSVARWERAA